MPGSRRANAARAGKLVARSRERAQGALLEPLHTALREALPEACVEALYAHQADTLAALTRAMRS